MTLRSSVNKEDIINEVIEYLPEWFEIGAKNIAKDNKLSQSALSLFSTIDTLKDIGDKRKMFGAVLDSLSV